LDGVGASHKHLQTYEDIMKQKIIESQTTPILYQHPTAEEQRPNRWQNVWVNAKEFSLFFALALVVWIAIHFCYLAVAG